MSVRTWIGRPLGALLVACAAVAGSWPAGAATIVRFQQKGVAGTYEATAADHTVQVSLSPAKVTLSFAGADSVTIGFGPAAAGMLAAGPYEMAHDATWDAGPLIEFSRTPDDTCQPGDPDYLGGRFTVLDIDAGPDPTQLNRFAADFELHCSNGSPIYGEVRYNSTVPLISDKPAGSTTPDAFAALWMGPVAPGSVGTSGWFEIFGVNAPVPISITGGEYSLNNGPFTSAPGTAMNQDEVVLRTRASRTPGGTANATFTAGGVSTTFSLTTYQPGMALTGIAYRSVLGESYADGASGIYLWPWNSMSLGGNDPGVHLDFTGLDGTTLGIGLDAPGHVPLVPGTYGNTTIFNNGGPLLVFDILYPSDLGTSRCLGASFATGQFIVREADMLSASVPQHLAVDSQYTCYPGKPPISVELRYDSTVPFSSLSQPAQRYAAADLDGDGRSDILYRNSTTGQVWRLRMNGLGMVDQGYASRPADYFYSWSVVADGDFTGDGVSDILWRDYTTGDVFLAPFGSRGMNVGPIRIYNEINPAWHIVQTPDLDGDGHADIVWWNSDTGQVYVMLMGSAGIRSQAMLYQEPNTAWRIVASGDFDGSGKQDKLVWHNDVTGEVYLMTVAVNAGTFSASGTIIYVEPNTDWQIVAAADFDGDGKADLLWRNAAAGYVYAMLMDGSARTSEGYVYVEPNLAWKIVATGDYDGDGKSDILWRNDTTGQVYMMLMDGLAITSQGSVFVEPNTDWKILGPAQYSP
jgi:hypothetical protein